MRRVLAVVTLAGGLAIAGLQDTRLTASVSKGSTQGYRAADHNPYGVNNEYGMVNLSIEQTTASPGGRPGRAPPRPRGRRRLGPLLAQLGERCSRPTIPNPSHWNWARADYDIDAAIDQGLNVYVTIQGAPAWPHGGVPTYHWLQCFAGNDNWDSTKPGCGPPGSANAFAPFDPAPGEGQSANWKRFVHAAVKRYGDRVKYWGFWNEPTERHFWPEWPEGGCHDRLAQLVAKVIKPGREAALAANPSVQIVGPDDYLPDSIAHLLNLERDGRANCGLPPAGRLFDVIALHSYNIPAGGGVLNTIQATLNAHFRREVWLTETNGGAGLQNALGHFERRGWISKVFVGSMRNPDTCGTHQPARRQQAAVSVLHRAAGLHRRASAGDARRRHDRRSPATTTSSC